MQAYSNFLVLLLGYLVDSAVGSIIGCLVGSDHGMVVLSLSSDEADTNSRTEEEEDSDDSSKSSADQTVDGCNLSEEIRTLHLNQDEYKATFLAKLRQPLLFSDQCCKSFLLLIGGQATQQRTKNVEQIAAWVNVMPVEKRKYIFLKKNDLVNLCISELHGSKTSYTSKRREDLIELLAQPRDLVQDPSNAPTQAPRLNLAGLLKKYMIEGAFLKPIHGESRRHVRTGLDNEEPLLLRLLEESTTKNVWLPAEPYREVYNKVLEIYRPGMVRMREFPYVKSSIDALGVLVGASHGAMLIGIEVKTRTVDKTRSADIDLKMTSQRGKTFVHVEYKK